MTQWAVSVMKGCEMIKFVCNGSRSAEGPGVTMLRTTFGKVFRVNRWKTIESVETNYPPGVIVGFINGRKVMPTEKSTAGEDAALNNTAVDRKGVPE
jgi:hypothetical protein